METLTGAGTASNNRWPLEMPLLSFPCPLGRGRFGAEDTWTLRDACEGTQIFGGTGSGKTSGSGHALARSFLLHNFGGLVLCVKVDERQTWQQYAKETGREDDVIVFSPRSGFRFNFLDYEMTREGEGAGQTENIAQLFLKALELGKGGDSGGRNEDPFWKNSTLEMLRDTIDLLKMAGKPIGLEEIYQVITSAPGSAEEVKSTEWANSSYLFECLKLAARNAVLPQYAHLRRDFELAARYWTKQFPNLSSRTRSIVVSMFTSMADGFLRGVMHRVFCTDSTIKPEFTHHGAIIILDFPLKEWGQVGVVAQGIFKYLWQQATERRDVRINSRPVFLWADESQHFVNSADAQFQATARSARACTVYLTQNISNYYAEMGGKDSRASTDSLLGNFQTKIFHTNGDAVTNEWASKQIAQADRDKESETLGRDMSLNLSHELRYQVEPSAFMALRNGGDANDLIVEAYIFKAGKGWKLTGLSHREVAFSQRY